MAKTAFSIPLGYSVLEETKTVSVDEAARLLLTKKQKKYTSAVRRDSEVLLTRHYISCPFCGSKTPAYASYLNKRFGSKLPDDYTGASEKTVLSWTTRQMSIFGDEFKDLHFHKTPCVTRPFLCPECHNIMKYNDGVRHIEVLHGNGLVSVNCEVVDARELMEMSDFLSNAEAHFPLYEVVGFDIESGRMLLGVQDGDGNLLCHRDITDERVAWTSGPLYRSIASNKYVRRAVKRAFDAEWGSKVPFSVSEFGIRQMQMATKFVGYDREFYSVIPFIDDSFCVDESFAKVGKKLRFSSNAHVVYEDSSLPEMKSVRRAFFQKPGLLFYIRECEKLWSTVGDPNYFVRLVSYPHIFIILSGLHMSPSISRFLRDYRKEMGIRKFMKLLNERWRFALEYGLHYVNMIPSLREHERKTWKSKEPAFPICRSPRYAVPMAAPDSDISNCYIDGFEFVWLRTSSDYLEAGKALGNCLAEWSMHHSPVVCMKKNGKIVGAAEVVGSNVIQAYSSDNRDLYNYPGLFEAYIKWCRKNRLSKIDTCDLDDDDDYPF